VIKKN